MSNFASGYVKYINHLEQINDAAVRDPQRMIREVEDAYHDHLENIARNITSHVYDEKTAEDVAAQICNDFFPLLKALGKFYRD